MLPHVVPAPLRLPTGPASWYTRLGVYNSFTGVCGPGVARSDSDLAVEHIEGALQALSLGKRPYPNA